MPGQERRGILYAVLAYLSWGLVPIYWKLLLQIPAIEILAHRVFWSLGFFVVLSVYFGQVKELHKAFLSFRIRWAVVGSATLLAANWGLFIYAVNSNRIVEAALGYFLNPIFNILLGTIFLGEKLKPAQCWALGLALLGTVVLTFNLGQLPWIALVLGSSFAFYGLIRKKISEPVWVTSSLESFYMLPFAFVIMLWVEPADRASSFDGTTWTLLAFSGVVTGFPLLMFTRAAQILPLSTLGFYQYISPTMQLTLGVLFYQEPFRPFQALSFSLIWMGLVINTISNLRSSTVKVVLGPNSPNPEQKPKPVS